MSIGSILYSLFFEPLQIFFEIVFYWAEKLTYDQGLSIIFLSIAMNILVFPLYKRADAMQEEEREIEKRLEKGVSHIKKTFKGDERMMMLQTYYRQNNYKPTYVLRGATSLFLQIPFFVAAYRFLSTLPSLDGESFGFITDLSQPDGLLTIGGISINVLPVIMTVINVVSSMLYSKDYPFKTKLQLYAVAVFFLVFLYNSPSGLVLYWTMNNVFSLFKTLFMIDRKKHPRDKKRKLRRKNEKAPKPCKKVFISGCVLLAVFTGAVIPSALINSSPQEFVFKTCYVNPLWYIVSSLCIAIGTFVIWCGIFYWLASPRAKCLLEKLVWIFSGTAIINYMAFGSELSDLSISLKFEEGLIYYKSNAILNCIIICLVIVAFYYIILKLGKRVANIMIVCTIAFSVMSVYNSVNISTSVAQIDLSNDDSDFNISLSKNENNVVIIMLDRALNEYIPYMFKEKPELTQRFDGFEYYTNVISFGGHTNFALPALWGGYEYTPAQINTRDDLTLAEKHNEALKVLPVLFNNNGFDVTVCNPIYANYKYIPDTSIYDEYDNISAYATGDAFLSNDVKNDIIFNNMRNFFVYSLTRSSPILMQNVFYQNGKYCKNDVSQTYVNKYVANGIRPKFMSEYSVLTQLSDITSVDNNKGRFMFMASEATHDVMMLQTPDYEVSEHVDNTEYYNSIGDVFTIDGVTLKFDSNLHTATYQSNVASLIQLCNWFDYLKAKGVYDNTKIIVASDHGYNIGQIRELMSTDSTEDFDAEYYYPLLMVKDFNSRGTVKTNDEFMTNADVATIACEDVIDNPINPFTGNEINSDEKFAHDQYIVMSEEYSIFTNKGNTFKPASWYSVHDSMWDLNNWSHVADDKVLTNNDIN